jgi:hypothetical protein
MNCEGMGGDLPWIKGRRVLSTQYWIRDRFGSIPPPLCVSFPRWQGNPDMHDWKPRLPDWLLEKSPAFL